MTKIIFSLVILFIGFSTSAQTTQWVTNVVAREIIGERISEEKARQEAIAKAKVAALQKAGVPENVQAYQMLYKSEIGTHYDEVFMSDVFSEIKGAVKRYEIVNEKKGIDEFQQFYIELTVNAEVVLYNTEKDPGFAARIDGIKQGYRVGEKMYYSVTPTRDCYLNIFNIYENNAALIYPNPYEKSRLFKAGEKVDFPLSSLLDGYLIEKSTKEPEVNKLVFVFTRDDIPYINFTLNRDGDQITSFEDVSAWLFSISPEKRVHYFIQFVIYD